MALSRAAPLSGVSAAATWGAYSAAKEKQADRIRDLFSIFDARVIAFGTQRAIVNVHEDTQTKQAATACPISDNVRSNRSSSGHTVPLAASAPPPRNPADGRWVFWKWQLKLSTVQLVHPLTDVVQVVPPRRHLLRSDREPQDIVSVSLEAAASCIERVHFLLYRDGFVSQVSIPLRHPLIPLPRKLLFRALRRCRSLFHLTLPSIAQRLGRRIADERTHRLPAWCFRVDRLSVDHAFVHASRRRGGPCCGLLNRRRGLTLWRGRDRRCLR